MTIFHDLLLDIFIGSTVIHEVASEVIRVGIIVVCAHEGGRQRSPLLALFNQIELNFTNDDLIVQGVSNCQRHCGVVTTYQRLFVATIAIKSKEHRCLEEKLH